MLTYQNYAWHLGIHAESIIWPQRLTQTPHPSWHGFIKSTQLDSLTQGWRSLHACTARVQEHHSKKVFACASVLQTLTSSGLQDLSPTGLGKQLQVGTTLQTSLAILCTDQGSEAFTLPTTRTSTQCRLTSQMHPVVRTLALPKEHIGCGACSSFLASTAK